MVGTNPSYRIVHDKCNPTTPSSETHIHSPQSSMSWRTDPATHVKPFSTCVPSKSYSTYTSLNGMV